MGRNHHHAAPPGPGGDPGPECAADITGTMTATPSSIDRETTTAPATTLGWSVVVPSGCHVSPIVTLAGRTVGLSGQMTVGVMRTITFFLRLAREHRDLAHATVTVQGDPGFINHRFVWQAGHGGRHRQVQSTMDAAVFAPASA
jgi:hypothetical protein